MADIFQNGIPIIILWIGAGLLALYMLVAFVTTLSAGSLFWQNILRTNRVQLPKMAKKEQVSGSGSGSEQAETMVLVRTGEGPGPAERGGLIYPALGRNGLNFKPNLCTSCGLCVFICPAKAITTPAIKDGYQRIFDMGKCIYCGLCESACPTQAILLTVEQHPAKLEASALLISGEVKGKKCPKCGANPPKANLLAARIYELASEPKICEECAKRVQKAEETVCE